MFCTGIAGWLQLGFMAFSLTLAFILLLIMAYDTYARYQRIWFDMSDKAVLMAIHDVQGRAIAVHVLMWKTMLPREKCENMLDAALQAREETRIR